MIHQKIKKIIIGSIMTVAMFLVFTNSAAAEVSIEPTSVSDITARDAVFQGRIQDLVWENPTPDDYAVYYFTISTSPEGPASFAAGPTNDPDVDGFFTAKLSESGYLLTCGTTYYVNAYVRVESYPQWLENAIILFDKTSTDQISFTTSDCVTLELDDVSNITKTGATLRALVQNKDWDDVTSQGSLEFTLDTAEDFSSEDQIYFDAGPIDESGYFTADVPVETPLTCGTTYYVMASLYTEGTTGVVYWSENYQDIGPSFTTADCISQSAPKRRVVGGYASSAYLTQQGIILETPSTKESSDTNQCPSTQLLTQNLKAPSRNGFYNSYTKGIVTEAKILQAHLNRLGFNSGTEDGILGPISTGAIKRMQTFLKTTPDGYVGPITRGLINNSCGSEGLKKN